MKKICMILVLCLAMMVAYGQADSKDTRIMVIKAIGVDEDIGGYLIPDSEYRAVTSIKAEVVLDENGNPLLLKELVFSTKIIDGLGEKVYTIEGELENTTVTLYPYSPCNVRNVVWTDVWVVMGIGKVKTTDIVIENFPYRNESITLPNTHGQYVTDIPIVFVVSPLGEITAGEPWGGWAFAGVVTSFTPEGMPLTKFGGITWLRQFVEQWAR